ncbi:MAG: spore maturation protein [Clostridia bacterium]|nr:spore maturation protein [Clostridia bacterium]
MDKIGTYIMPLAILGILCFGFAKKTDVYSSFISGVKEGFSSVASIFPALFALFLAVGVFRASGLVDLITRLISPLTNAIGFPSELVPFALLRPVSGSGSLAMASDIFSKFGPDSFEGMAVSVMMGSTETTFYTTAVYFAASGTKNIRHTLKCALIADLFSMAVSIIVCRIFYAP